MLNIKLLQKIFPNVAIPNLTIFLVAFNKHLPEYEINTDLRMASFLAQVGHESGDLRWLVELWGPTPQQRKYDPPSAVAAQLGNTQKGDGYRFRGRGLIQITGRSNYATLSQVLNLDLIAQPDKLATPDLAVKSAAWFWGSRQLNLLADANNLQAFQTITLRINGGLNGFEDRQRKWVRIKKIFDVE